MKHRITVELPKSLTVLIVDDDPDFRKLMQVALERSNHVVYTTLEAGSLGETKEVLLNNAVDAVTLDIRLPDNDDENGVLELRDVDGSVPIVILTGFDDYSDEKAIALGANAFLHKDEVLKGTKLSKTIRLVVLRHRYQQAVEQAKDTEHRQIVDGAVEAFHRSVAKLQGLAVKEEV